MGAIVALTIIIFAVIYFLNLQNELNKVKKVVDRNGPPLFSRLIQGDFDNPLDKPMDVTKIGEFIYVTDTNHKQVQAFDSSGSPIFKFGKEGEGEGEFKFPYGIAGDKKGNVYVADMYNGKISIFTQKGKFIKFFEEKDSVKLITSPAGLRIYDEKLYVTDIQQAKVYVFKLDGEKILEIATGGSQNERLNAPNAVTIDNDNNIYVSDSGNQQVLVYDKNGKYQRKVNGSKGGKGKSIFVNPRGIGVTADGKLYVVDNMSHYVFGFDKKGKKLFQFGGMGDGNEQFYLPNGLFIDEKEQIYITDTFNQRAAVYY